MEVSSENEGGHDLNGFLTTTPNTLIARYHPKAVPVILTNPSEVETWLTAPIQDALALQRPLPDDALQIVLRGEKQMFATLRSDLADMSRIWRGSIRTFALDPSRSWGDAG